MPCAVPGCPDLVGVPGSASGLCPRHYQAQRRGKPLVAAPAKAAPGEGRELTIRLSRELLEAAEAAANRAGVSVREWVREAVRRRLSGEDKS